MKFIRKTAVFLFCLCIFNSVHSGNYIDYTDLIDQESEWIRSLQTSTGGILSNKGSGNIVDGNKVVGQIEPYFANFAMLGLLNNPTVENLKVVKKWIGWYISHLNTSSTDYNGLAGTVYRYYVDYNDDTIEYSEGGYDSTDSYAATFLSVVKKYVQMGGDHIYVQSIQDKLKIVADAILATQTSDGLTWAKPDYKIKYLMDNAEVAMGLADYAWLLQNTLNNPNAYTFFNEKYTLCVNGIENLLWNSSNNNYNWHLNGVSTWSNWYPQAGAQTYPIYCRLIEPNSTRAQSLYSGLNTHFPDWADGADWTLQASVAAIMGDYDRVHRFIYSVQNKFLQRRQWPWRTSESGSLIEVAYQTRKELNYAFGASFSASNIDFINRLNDGLTNSSFILSHSSTSKWILIDLGEIKSFSELKILSSSLPNAYNLKVETSTDNINYTSHTFSQRVENSSRYSSQESINARYIKLPFDDINLSILIKEIEIYQSNPTIYDLVVYGGTSSGVIAATAAAKQGLSVLLIEPTNHVGGMTSSGLGYVDVGKSFTIGGLTNNFFQRNASYQGLSGVSYRITPSIAEKIFNDMLSESKVNVLYNSRLDEDTTTPIINGRIRSIQLESGVKIQGKYFIDSSYEGDLMASAGISYIVGRESGAEYNEPGAGKRSPYTFAPLNPYQSNGQLLPDLYEDITGTIGDADDKTQAYNFRLCLTQNASNFIAFTKPENYNPLRYELLLQTILRREAEGNQTNLTNIVSIATLPGGKTDFNNNGMFSTDLINASWNYPEATYAEREAIWKDHKNYTQGLFYFLGNDTRVPLNLRNEVLSWGLCKDEFIDSDYWPRQLYIRESRRMLGEYVMKQSDAWSNAKKTETIGMGSYMMDSHYVRKYVENGVLKMEGLMGHQPVRPYEISYRSLTPQKIECQNLLVPVCLSASHVIYGSIRMEPVYMILGESAGTAIAQAVNSGLQPVQDIDIIKLQNTLKANGQILSYDGGVYLKSDFDGIVIDDLDAVFKGKWSVSANSMPFMEEGGYKYTNDQTASSQATYSTTIQESGIYNIFYMYSPGNNRATNAKISFKSLNTTKDFIINMRNSIPTSTYPFVKLGTFELKANELIQFIINNDGADGLVIADAFLVSLVRKIDDTPGEDLSLDTEWEFSASKNNIQNYVAHNSYGARGMALGIFNDKKVLAVPTRTPGVNVYLLNAATGEKIDSLNTTGISGGAVQVSDAGITDDGKILVSNVAIKSGATFKVYMWDNSINPPTVILSYQLPEAGRYGDEITVTGSISDGTAQIYAASSISVGGVYKILRFVMVPDTQNPGNYLFNPIPEEFSTDIKFKGTIPSLGFAPNNKFIYKGHDSNLVELDSSGKLTGNVLLAGSQVSMPGCSPQTIMQRDYDLFLGYFRPENGYECAEIIKIPSANWTSGYSILKTPMLGTNQNSNKTGRLLVEQTNDKTYLYVLSTNNGIGKYALNLIETNVESQFSESITIRYFNKILFVDGINAPNVEIIDLFGRKVQESIGKNQIILSKNLTGVYIVRVSDENQVKKTVKIIIK